MINLTKSFKPSFLGIVTAYLLLSASTVIAGNPTIPEPSIFGLLGVGTTALVLITILKRRK